MFFFCRQGQENLHGLEKDSFSFATDSSGKKYVFQVKDEMTKNRRENDEAKDGGYMYERPDDVMCPVKSFVKYLSKLNPKFNCNALYLPPWV